MYWNFSDLIFSPARGGCPPRGARLIAEIGFGNGEYLAHLARTHSDALVVGIEVSQWCICKAARRSLAEKLGNVKLIHGDARYLMRRIFLPESLDEVYMNFPCPWPKKRHASRRVSSPYFASLLRDTLKPRGAFILATDVDWYAEATQALFAGDSSFTTGDVVVNPARDYVSKYERKWKTMERDTFVLKVVKNDGVDVEDVGEARYNDAMDETLDGLADAKKDLGALLASLEGVELEGRGFKGFLKNAFISADGSALVSAISVDEGFEQHFYIKVIPTQSGLRAKIDAVGHPYRTPGVRACFGEVLKALRR